MDLKFGSVQVLLGEKSGKYPDGNQVLVHGPEMRVAFDTPLATRQRAACLNDIDLVILGHVHEDHMAALDLMPDDAAVQVHRFDLEAARTWQGLKRHYGYDEATLDSLRGMLERDFHYAERPTALPYDDQESWDLGAGIRISAHHLPGHTAGHCALVVEPEGVAFIGDIDLSGFGPYYGDATSNLTDFRHTLKRVAQLDARVWVTSHHRGVITNRGQFLADLARFAARIEERTDLLLQRLGQRPQSIAELAAPGFLYPAAHQAPWTGCAERRTIAQHLTELQALGLVHLQEDGKFALV